MLAIFSDYIQDYFQVVNKSTHLGGELPDHVYVKEAVLKEFTATCTMLNIYFSDHDAIEFEILAEDVDFQCSEHEIRLLLLKMIENSGFQTH